MFKILCTLLLTLTLQANILDFKTFKASFLQTIVDDNNKRITYSGDIYIQGENSAVWNYNAPIKKSLIFSKDSLIIIEPELEQVFIKGIDDNINIHTILHNAKKINKTTYKGTFNNKKYLLHVNNNAIEDIQYKDDFDNSVTISFENQVVNSTLKKSIFIPVIPKDYDIIRE